jgi:hypothetical protein
MSWFEYINMAIPSTVVRNISAFGLEQREIFRFKVGESKLVELGLPL